MFIRRLLLSLAILIIGASPACADSLIYDGQIYVRDTDESNRVQLKWNENDSSDRVLNISVNGADRNWSLSSDLTIDQDLSTTSDVEFSTVDTGQGANELYDMDQDVLTTSDVAFDDLTLSGQIVGGFGASSISGTLDWNDTTNSTSGSGPTLLMGDTANGPGPASYYHPFTFEYNNGSGNMTQFAIPYRYNYGLYLRDRYSSSWSSWAEIWTSETDGTGSGLDADLWDGNEFASYLNQAVTTTSNPTFNRVYLSDYGYALGGFHVGGTSDPGASNLVVDGAINAATVNTGQGANELYDMNQNVMTTSAVTFATVNTGQGANELYDMNQNVMTSSSPTFANMYIADKIYHSGDTNTYMDFVSADTWRVVTGGTERMRISSSGYVGIGDTSPDYPLDVAGSLRVSNIIYEGGRPTFLAYNTTTDSNITGDRTSAKVDFDTEAFDVGNCFASDTFTAPVSGRYLLSATVKFSDLDADTYENGNLYIITTDGVDSQVYPVDFNPSNCYTVLGTYTATLTVIADMLINDTSYVEVSIDNGTKSVDVEGFATIRYTTFSGSLMQTN